MYKKLIEKATDEQVREFLTGVMAMLKETNGRLYKDLESNLYEKVCGNHFCEWSLENAVDKFINEDGTKGAHWSVEETSNAAKQYNIEFDDFNKYDWNYVMNMIYSDFYGVVPNNIETYVRLSKRFIDDKDAPQDKAFVYYNSMR